MSTFNETGSGGAKANRFALVRVSKTNAKHFAAPHNPKFWTLTIPAYSSFTDDGNQLDFGGCAVALQVVNTGSQTFSVKMNNDPEAVLAIAQNEELNFEANAVHVTEVAFANYGSSDATVNVLAGVVLG